MGIILVGFPLRGVRLVVALSSDEDEKRWLNFGGSIGPEGTLLEKTFLNQKMFVMQQCITSTNFRAVSQKITNAGQRNRA